MLGFSVQYFFTISLTRSLNGNLVGKERDNRTLSWQEHYSSPKVHTGDGGTTAEIESDCFQQDLN